MVTQCRSWENYWSSSTRFHYSSQPTGSPWVEPSEVVYEPVGFVTLRWVDVTR